MKKLTAVLAAGAVLFSLAACGSSSDAGSSAAGTAKSEGVMTYSEYAAAALDTEVTIETYVQDKQGWWENEGVGNATFYTQDAEGGYFLYNMPCTKEDYDAMVPGTKIKVTGYKSEWAGEVELSFDLANEKNYEIESGDTYVATAQDLTASFADEDALAAKQNTYATFKGLTVADSNGAAFLYNWDGSGSQGDDIYFKLSDANGNTRTFVIESYLRGADTDVYKAVEALNVGDTVDVTGFLYWYEGPQVHTTDVVVK